MSSLTYLPGREMGYVLCSLMKWSIYCSWRVSLRCNLLHCVCIDFPVCYYIAVLILFWLQKGGQETGDIIKFYNEIFVHSTKTFLLHIGSAPVSSNAHGLDEGNCPNSKGAWPFWRFWWGCPCEAVDMVWLCVCYAHLVGRCVQAFVPAFFQMNVLNSAVDDVRLISENRIKSFRQQFLFWSFSVCFARCTCCQYIGRVEAKSMRERLNFLWVSFAGILVEQINSKIISEPKHFRTMMSNLQPNGAVTCFFLLFSSPNFRTGQLYDAGESPASPGCPAFPVLPDMSPKKVSAMHNVFVSPLRARKVCGPEIQPNL